MKPGYKTTEFWLTLFASVVGAALSSGLVADDKTLRILGFVSTILSAFGYTAVRTVAKKQAADHQARQDLHITYGHAATNIASAIASALPSKSSPSPQNTPFEEPDEPEQEMPLPENTIPRNKPPRAEYIEDHALVTSMPEASQKIEAFKDVLGLVKLSDFSMWVVGAPTPFTIKNVFINDKPLWTSGVDSSVFRASQVVVTAPDMFIEKGSSLAVEVHNPNPHAGAISIVFGARAHKPTSPSL
jgi:hypothetical protein